MSPLKPTRRLLLPLLAALSLHAPPARAQSSSAFTHNADDTWSLSQPGYKAVINKDGYLSSLTVKGVEAVGDPFSYNPGAKLVADKWTADGNTLTVHLKGNGEASIVYLARPDGITITPTWNGGGFADMHFNGSKSLLGIELLNEKRPILGGESTQFVEHGEVRGVPAVQSSRNQMVRFHYPGFNIHAYVQAWGAPFNYESAGGIDGYRWGRQLLSANQPFPIIFDIETTPAGPTLPAPVFVPRALKAASLYYTNEPCTWNIDLGERKAYQYLLDAGVTGLALQWQLMDVHSQVVSSGKEMVPLSATAATTLQPVTLHPPGSGFYQALFSLSDPGGKALTSSFLTRFTVIHPILGMTNRDDSLFGKGYSDYSIMGMIGIGAIRESHNMSEFFTNAAQTGPGWTKVEGADPGVWMNTQSLDGLFNGAASESQKYHLVYFFQANSRPAYATPAIYEAMAYALVSRYKDRCHTWEVENEPNFSYSPENYVKQALIPFATGAKRADPTCTVMGPDCVSLKQTLEFMQTIYALKANQYLDNVSTHSYPGPGESWEQFGNTATVPELKSWMAAHGDGQKALWQTEQGYTWDGPPEVQAARYTTRQFLQGWRMGILPEHQYYFYPQWHGFEDWYLQGSGEEGSRDSWLPSGAALRFLAENTHGMTFEGDIPSPYKGIYLSRFTGPDEDVVAAWTFDFSASIAIKAAGLTRVVSYMGNPVVPSQDKPGIFSVAVSGEPVYIHLRKGSAFTVLDPPYGRNLAADAAGGGAVASSEAPDHPASNANDGNWNLWEDVPGLKGRTAWQSAVKDPSPERPDWLQVNFPTPRTINRIVALCYLPAVNPSPRDFEFQVDQGGKWKTVASGKDEFIWSLERSFPAVTTSHIRMVITKINDGWHRDRRWMHVLMGPKATNYTDSKVLVSELEAYGPASGVQFEDVKPASSVLSTPSPEVRAFTAGVHNYGSAGFKGSVRIEAPAGWKVTPSVLTVLEIAGSGQKALNFRIDAPALLSTGRTPVMLRLQDSAGKLVDVAQAFIDIASPVQLTPNAPTVLNATDQPLSITVKNITEAPLSGTVSLSTGGAGTVAEPNKTFGPIAAGGTTNVAFSVKGLRLVGSHASLLYTVTAGGLSATARQDFALRGWQVVGPYPSPGGTGGFDTVYDPEKKLDLSGAYPVMNGQTTHWLPAFNDSKSYVDLLPFFNPHENVVAYAHVYVKSPTARKAIFSAGSDDGIKGWLNGKVVVSDNASRGAAPGQDEAPVQLKAGWNEILLKITQGGYGWGFYFDLLDANHGPMTDLVYGAVDN